MLILKRCRTAIARAQRGMSLIEVLAVMCIATILAAVALPSYHDTVRTGRRSDGIGALAALQSAEERYRSAHTQYGAPSEIGAGTTSPAGFYALDVVAHDATGYVAVAAASGVQFSDSACRWLQVSSSGDDVRYASGPDRGVANDADANRRCWRS